MNLPRPTVQYDVQDQNNLRGELEREDKRNLKVGVVFDKIQMKDTATGVVKTIKMTSGALVIS